MLKFNIKEHKLEELEKYGFKREYYNDTLVSYCFYFDVKQENPLIYISKGNYKLLIFTLFDKNENILTLNTLYDLIKDGLVIKEQEDEAFNKN